MGEGKPQRRKVRIVQPQRRYIDPMRHHELLQEAPTITAEEAERLSSPGYQPRRKLTAIFTRLALMLLWTEALGRKQAEAARNAALKRSMQPIPGSETADREARGEYEHREYATSPAV